MIEYILFGLDAGDNITNLLPVIKESIPGQTIFRYTILKRHYKKRLTKFMVENIKSIYYKKYYDYCKHPVIFTGAWYTDDSFLACLLRTPDTTVGKNIKYMYYYIIEG